MLTPGKLAGMKAVSDKRGVIAAAAMDQRGSLRKSLAKERGSEITDAMMEEFKILVTEVLTQHASAILLDPEWGLPASKRRAKDSGLLMAYEKTGYDAATPGRLPDLLNDWSVRRLKEAGADCIKILLYYTPTDPASINDQKHAWVERIGDECIANDIPFFLELIGYEEGVDEKGIEFAKKKPQIVAAEHGRVLEGPVRRGRAQGRSSGEHEVRRGRVGLQGPGRVHARRGEEALSRGRDRHEEALHLPVSRREQRGIHGDARALIAESGVKYAGVLCGRATWKDGIPVYAKQGARGVPEVARDGWRREHLERQQGPRARDVRGIRFMA